MPDELLHDLSPAEAADLLGVHPDTLKRWAAAGKVRAFRTPGGWWRFRRADLVDIVNVREPQDDTGSAA